MARLGRSRKFKPLILAQKVTLTAAEIRIGKRNLLTFTEAFDNAAWTLAAASVSANATTDPFGGSTADKLVEDTSINANHTIRQQNPFTAGTYTLSVYAKAAERSFVYISWGDFNVDEPAAAFRLSTGEVYAVVGPLTLDNASIVNVGGGWYRCSVTRTIGSTPAAPRQRIAVYNGGALNYTGDGTSGIYIWGAQFEVGSLTGYQQVLGATNTNGESSDTVSISTSLATSVAISAVESSDTTVISTSVTTGAAIAATESSDTCAISAANWRTAQIAAVESADLASVSTSVTTSAAIAATESPDTATVSASNWTTAQVAATESPDTCAIATSVMTGAAIAAVESSDTCAIAALGNATITYFDIAALESSDTVAIATSVTTGAAIAAVESSDVASISAINWRTSQIVALESSDSASISVVVTAGAVIAVTESPDTTAVAVSTGTTVVFIEATESSDVAVLEATAAAAQVENVGVGPPLRRPRLQVVSEPITVEVHTEQVQSVSAQVRVRMTAAIAVEQKQHLELVGADLVNTAEIALDQLQAGDGVVSMRMLLSVVGTQRGQCTESDVALGLDTKITSEMEDRIVPNYEPPEWVPDWPRRDMHTLKKAA